MLQLKIRKSKSWSNIIFGAIMGIALLLLIALMYFYVRPLQLVDIKVPVATDKSSYYPGQKISGIFFGEVYYNGKVDVLREVYCKDYKMTIKTDDGDTIFKGISRALKLDGVSRYIGFLPADVPVGANCVIQFANTYRITTPFGVREETVLYYTQNFTIVSVDKRQQIECENAGGTDCIKYTSPNAIKGDKQPTAAPANNDSPLYDVAPTETQQAPSQVAPMKETPKESDKKSEPIVAPSAESCTLKVLGLCVKI